MEALWTAGTSQWDDQKWSLRVLLSSGAIVALGQPASAETLKFLTNLDYQTFSSARDAVPSDKSGDTIVKFKVKTRATIDAGGGPAPVTGIVVGGDEMPAGQHQLKVAVQPVNGAAVNLHGSALRIED